MPLEQSLDSARHKCMNVNHYPADTVSIKEIVGDFSNGYTWGVTKTKTLVN